LDFISEYLTLILFAIILIIALVIYNKNHSLDARTSVWLVWVSVAASLGLTYIIGIVDWGFFESSLLGFGKKEFLILLVPGAITLLILIVKGFPEFIHKVKGHDKGNGGGR